MIRCKLSVQCTASRSSLCDSTASYLYPFWELIHIIRPVDGSSRVMAQTTQIRTRICIFLGFVDITAHLGFKS